MLDGLVGHGKLLRCCADALAIFQHRIEYIAHNILRITLPGVKTVGQPRKGLARVLAVKTLDIENRSGGNSTSVPLGFNGVKAPADQAKVARGFAEGTAPGKRKPDSLAGKKIPLAFTEYRD